MSTLAVSGAGWSARDRSPGVGRGVRIHRVTALIALVVALVAVVVVWQRAAVASSPAVGMGVDDGASTRPLTALHNHVIAPGDTVWDLATRLSGGGDPRPMVDRIMRLNGLSSANIEPGTVIVLPATS